MLARHCLDCPRCERLGSRL
ncbi:MAG: hypothetical protein EB145_16820 [Proteobacteria bacterium]|nr:hypothetical protein [Pseudomonadota bacterium]